MLVKNLLNNKCQSVLTLFAIWKHSRGQSTQGGPITYVVKGRGEPLNAGGPRRLRNDIPLGSPVFPSGHLPADDDYDKDVHNNTNTYSYFYMNQIIKMLVKIQSIIKLLN